MIYELIISVNIQGEWEILAIISGGWNIPVEKPY
jgi:hypothetical protein